MVGKDTKTLINNIVQKKDITLHLQNDEIIALIDSYIDSIEIEPMVKSIKAGNMIVVGDIHGDFTIMKKIVEFFFSTNRAEHLIFLGDIVDRGSNSIACLNLLLALLLKFPKRVHIVRGNHEAISVNSRYGFLQETIMFDKLNSSEKKDSESFSIPELYLKFNEAFGYMPLIIIHEKTHYFFVHGGIPYELCGLVDIKNLPKGDLELNHPVIRQLLWNDPNEEVYLFGNSIRGDGIYFYGHQAVSNFLDRNELKMIIRAHEAFPLGYKYFFNNKLLSLFSSEENYADVHAKIALIYDEGKIDILEPNGEKSKI